MVSDFTMLDLIEKFHLLVIGEKVNRERRDYNYQLEHGYADYLREKYSLIARGAFTGYTKESIYSFLDSSYLYNYEPIAEFFKHAKCQKVYVGNGSGYVKNVENGEVVSLEDLNILDEEQIAILDKIDDEQYLFRLADSSKFIEMKMLLKPKRIVTPTIVIPATYGEHRSVYMDKSFVLKVTMSQYTEDGFYYAYFDGQDYWSNGWINFYNNDSLRKINVEQNCSGRKLTDYIGTLQCFYENVVTCDSWSKFRVHTDSLEHRVLDAPLLASKMFNEGLPYLLQLGMNNGYLEIHADEKDLYELTYGEKEYTKLVQKLVPEEPKFILTEEKLLEEVEDMFIEDTPVYASVPTLIANLMQLRNLGVELSEEQERTLMTYERLHSDEFRQFQDDRDNRMIRQAEIRKQVSLENAEKEEWFNSSDNPSNVRVEELSHMRKQIEVLDKVREVDESLLTDEQIDMIDKGKIFFEMKEKTDSEMHEIDTGMSNETREWYQEHYKSR